MSEKSINELEIVVNPFENSIGQDPRYDINFLRIKNESEKLSGIDYAFIFEQCQNMLQQFKDLRLANYLVWAATYLDGVQGLIQGLALYQQLIENYSLDIHPQRTELRIATIKWLDQEKLIWFLDAKSSLELSQWDQLSEKIERLSFVIKQKYHFTNDLLPGLRNFVAGKIKKLQHSLPSMTVKAENNLISFQKPSRPIISIEELIQHLWEQKDWLSAAAYARALRWSTLQTPPAIADITKIPAPRAAAISQLHAHIKNEDALKLYLHCEALLLEPSGQVWLDLQFYAVTAAKRMDAEDLAEFIEMQTIVLCKRLPRLPELQFADQKPFADIEAKSWLASLLTTAETRRVVDNAHEELSVNQILAELKLKKLSKLEDKIAAIQAIISNNQRQDFIKDWAIAKILAKEKYYESAHIKFLQLDQTIKQHQLMTWEPSLIFEIWSDWHCLLSQYFKKINEDGKNSIKNIIRELKQDLLRLDSLQAIILLNKK